MITAILNGLSDHDAQLLMNNTDYTHIPIQESKIVRKINNYTMSHFFNKLSKESWDIIFNSDTMFNSCLNIYLRIFYSSFPPKREINRNNNDNIN